MGVRLSGWEEGEAKEAEVMPTRFFIKKADLEKHGYTARCPGCVAILRGTARQGHSEGCRTRLAHEMRDEKKVRDSQVRFDDFVVKNMEENDEAQKKKQRTEKDESGSGGASSSTGVVRLPESMLEIPTPMDVGTGASSSSASASASRTVRADEEMTGKDDEGEAKRPRIGAVMTQETNEEEDAEWEDEVFDEKTGALLGVEDVRRARAEELDFMRKIPLFDVVPEAECWARTGRPPVSTKWVDINKGTPEKPDVRCRLVARDFKPKGEKDREDLFAAMPPLEAKKLLFRMAAACAGSRGGTSMNMKLMFIDVKKAHLNGTVGEDECAYIMLAPEDKVEGRCGRLRKWLYGMRPAASAWERDYTEKLESIGLMRGRSAPTVFFNSETLVRCVVHGDDFTFMGPGEELKLITKAMKGWYDLKVRATLGEDPGDDRHITILNRTLRWKSEALIYEADEKHVKMICDEMGLEEGSKGLDAPIVKEDMEVGDEEEELLSGNEKTQFRALAARANYLAQDRMDIQFATKEICRHMATPKKSSWQKLKRLSRYLLEYPRAEWVFEFRSGVVPNVIDAYSDSDWAGCKATRKSTSGGVLSVGGGAVKSWGSTQGTIATSSGEAELYALAKAASEGLGLRALAADLGWDLAVRVWVDSSAAKAIASKTGLGRMRHLEVKYLWVQEALKAGRIEIRKILGTQNPADVATKPHGVRSASGLLESVGCRLVGRGRRICRPLWSDRQDDEVGE